MTTVKSYAKINLCLNLVGKTDRYHDLESVVISVGLYDTIKAKKRKDNRITLKTEGVPVDVLIERNNAYKSAKLFMETFKTNGVDLKIIKRIPIGGGLGGSSADSAGVLRAMAKLYEITSDLSVLANALGSDTSYQLSGGFAVMRGRGDEVEFLKDAPKLNILLAIPETGVNTGECYKEADRLEKTEFASVNELIDGVYDKDYAKISKNAKNGLFEAAKNLNGEVKATYEEVKKLSPSVVSMTGSGSAIFAVFSSRRLCALAENALKERGINAISTFSVKRVK